MERIMSVAEDHISRLGSSLSTPSKAALLRSTLAGIHFCRCTSDYELLALFLALVPAPQRPSASQTAPVSEKVSRRSATPRLPLRTSLILIDTISHPLRAPLPDDARHLRSQRHVVFDELRHFSERCRRRGIKLVLSNQMAVTIVSRDGLRTSMSDKDGEGRLVPLLRNQSGSILGPNVWRLLLFRSGSQNARTCNRFAHIINQPASMGRSSENDSLPWLPFCVQSGGIVEYHVTA